VLLFQIGQNTLGAMLVNSRPLPAYQVANLPIWLRTFAHNLAAHWHNLQLFAETRQRSLEMEILYGRYIDTIWNPEAASLYASYQQNKFQLIRDLDKEFESEETIPLLLSDYPLGQVSLPDDVQLTQDQSELVHALIREMGNALNNAYLLQTTRATSNQLSLATEVSRAATTILDRDQLIREVVELIRGRFNFYYVGLFLIDEKGETAVLQSGTGEAGRLQVERKHYQLIGGPSMIGTCIADGRAIVEQDVTQAKAFKFNPLLPNTRSELAMPLRTRGQIIGALTVQSNQKGAFTSETVAVLQSLADQLAIAIENAGLFAQTQATLAETSRLYQASRQISEAQSAPEVYQALVNFARDSGQVDAAFVVIVSPEDPAYLVAPATWSRRTLKINRLARRPFEFNKQLEKNEIVLIADPNSDTWLDEATRQLFHQNKIQSAALIPIYVEKSWLGTFMLLRTHSEPFGLPMLTAYRTLADQAAVILSNQQLFAEIKAANEKLRQLDQLKTQFLANMSHELRTPLNSIIGFSRVILKGIDGPITPEQEEDLTSIHNNGQHLLSLINEVLDMAKIEAGKMALTFEPINLEAAAQAVFASTRALVREGVELIWDVQSNLPSIEADPVRLRQILMNLLSNAAKFTYEGTIRLDVFQDAEDHVHIAVHDTGIGIAPQEFEVLFKPFEQVDNSTTRKAGGTGLGLPITKWLVNMHEGHIWVESLVSDGTTVHVRLPLRQTIRNLSEPTFMESLSTS
jgi:signal transduction histidine kinase